MKSNHFLWICCVLGISVANVGCLSVKTEHEVKPIEINMNINLKMDKQIEEAVSKEQPIDIRNLLDRGVIGIDKNSMFAPRGALTAEEVEYLGKLNSKHKGVLEKIATENGKSYEEVSVQAAKKFIERLPSGKNIQYQTSDGTWTSKK